MNILSIARYATIGFSVFGSIAACATTTSSSEVAEGEVTARKFTEQQCAAEIEKSVLKVAKKVNATASIDTINHSKSQAVRRLYGNAQTAQITLVRVTDETEPSDYLVVRGGKDGQINDRAGECRLTRPYLAAEGIVPGDTNLAPGKIGAKCKGSIEKAVLSAANETNESIRGMKLIFGGDKSYRGSVIVRTNSEDEAKDYLVGFSVGGDADQNAGVCAVTLTQMVAIGTLPPIDGL
jgi:hypothetical protein